MSAQPERLKQKTQELIFPKTQLGSSALLLSLIALLFSLLAITFTETSRAAQQSVRNL